MSYIAILILSISLQLSPREDLPPLQHRSLVDRFYSQRKQTLFWYAQNESADAFRRQLLSCIDSAAWQGLDSNRYQPRRLRQLNARRPDDSRLPAYDRFYTDVAITLSLDLLRGGGNSDSIFSFDAIAPRYSDRDDQFLLDGLSRLATAEDLKKWTDDLVPAAPTYAVLKSALRQALDSADRTRSRQLATTMNVWRRILHYHFDRFIVVNIPSATLRYFAADTLALQMKIIAGQVSKRTPRFAAFCHQLILYPYWNIPRKIAVKELLPLFKKAPDLAAIMNIQALDNRGRKADITTISWTSYTPANFPYQLRQAPGCDNALGVLKFDISSPFNVYLHDTNLKKAFSSSSRYFSHGCIRLERPLELGRLLLDNKLDTSYLRSCFRDQQPVAITLKQAVPVFVLYLTVNADPVSLITWHKDVYHLLK